jgi:hypothetical protein
LQRITNIEIFTWGLEVLLNLICERLRKVSIARCEVNLLGRADSCRGSHYRSCGGRPRFIILDAEMGVKNLFGRVKVGAGIQVVTAVCEEATI